MPKQLTHTELSLASKRIMEQPKIEKKAITSLAGPQTLAQIKQTQTSTAAAAPSAPKPQPARFDFRIELVGLSATDDDVADYYQQLVACPLLDHVDMIYSSDTIVDEVAMRKFRIEATIKPTADARTIEPLHVPRMNSKPGGPTPTLTHAPSKNPSSHAPTSITGVPTSPSKPE